MMNEAKQEVKSFVRSLYFGASPKSRIFRYSLLAFDIATIIFFVISSIMEHNSQIIRIIEYSIAIVIFLDIFAQFLVSNNRILHASRLTTWIDIAVFISLLVPALVENFTFLRVIRALRLLRSYQVLNDLRRKSPYFKEHEPIIQSSLNLFVFIFTVSAIVYVLQARSNPNISHFLDALYFTITTLTTTGFGDVTLQGNNGKILSIIIMVVGVGLFIRLVQTIFRPTKIEHQCPQCGLNRHDTDAVHCKHCGNLVKIETEGAG